MHMQEDKEPLFDAVDTMQSCLGITNGVLSTLTIVPERMQSGLVYEMLATDLAEYLVRKGVPFRETHHVAGAAVKLAEDTGMSLKDLTLSQLQELHPAFEDDVASVWDFDKSVERRDVVGGTSKRAVLESADALADWIQAHRQ
eukprot:m.142532 g.142532  ORF g.142532 m.142532 type:complete len:143 (+) comp17142_c0_seq1:1219-1647(+)